ncbi:MAG: hypothetical protein HRT87_07200, partial [Legionellales bacterium]|nr:hypothetical protein [Legionellales bacterium]
RLLQERLRKQKEAATEQKMILENQLREFNLSSQSTEQYFQKQLRESKDLALQKQRLLTQKLHQQKMDSERMKQEMQSKLLEVTERNQRQLNEAQVIISQLQSAFEESEIKLVTANKNHELQMKKMKTNIQLRESQWQKKHTEQELIIEDSKRKMLKYSKTMTEQTQQIIVLRQKIEKQHKVIVSQQLATHQHFQSHIDELNETVKQQSKHIQSLSGRSSWLGSMFTSNESSLPVLMDFGSTKSDQSKDSKNGN